MTAIAATDERRVWIQMPTTGTGSDGDPVRPVHPVEGTAFLLNKDGYVYVVFRDTAAREAALASGHGRALTDAEAWALEESLSFVLPARLFPADDGGHGSTGTPGLGDLVSRLTRRLGIRECAACRARKRVLNRIPVWGWWRG